MLMKKQVVGSIYQFSFKRVFGVRNVVVPVNVRPVEIVDDETFTRRPPANSRALKRLESSVADAVGLMWTTRMGRADGL